MRHLIFVSLLVQCRDKKKSSPYIGRVSIYTENRVLIISFGRSLVLFVHSLVAYFAVFHFVSLHFIRSHSHCLLTRWTNGKMDKIISDKNKAVYTAAEVACGWAGAVKKHANSNLWAGAVKQNTP